MNTLKKYMVIGIIFVSILGTFLHFLFEWSGRNVLVGLFTPVNESIWEHTKLLFFPMLIYSMYLNKKAGKEYPCLSSVMTLSAVLGMALIITLFYTYSGILGRNIAIFDITIFYISVITSFIFTYETATSCKTDKYSSIIQLLKITIILLFILFTYSPPGIPLFMSPYKK